MYLSTELFLLIIDKFQLLVESIEENKEVIKFTIEEAKNLVLHNEELVAYENLCANLYEFDIRFDREMYDNLVKLGTMLDANHSYWSDLQELVQ